jgi:hypothetical protein
MQGTLFISMFPSSFRYLRIPSFPSPSPSPSPRTSPPYSSKQGSAPNSSVSITYWHGNRLIICLYNCRKRKHPKEKTTEKLKNKQTSIASVPDYYPTTTIFPTPLIFHCTQSFSQSFWRFNATYINTFVQHIWLATTKPYCIPIYVNTKYIYNVIPWL